MSQCAPLSLLFENSTDTVADSIMRFLNQNSEIMLLNGRLGQSMRATLLVSAMTFTAKLEAISDEIAVSRQIFCNIDRTKIGCVLTLDFGDHIAGANAVPIIVQTLFSLACQLGTAASATGLWWHPSQIISGFGYFCDAVDDYELGGAFPVLSTISFDFSDDGVVESNGLAWFSGQEIKLAAPAMGKSEVMRRVVRIVHDIATNGAIASEIIVDGLAPGEQIRLLPCADADADVAFVQGYIGSDLEPS